VSQAAIAGADIEDVEARLLGEAEFTLDEIDLQDLI